VIQPDHLENPMLPIPADIFTEPEVSPDDIANLGPLRRLAGVWQADKGVDINPKAKARSDGCFARRWQCQCAPVHKFIAKAPCQWWRPGRDGSIMLR
jgi:hypothetical protein